jgi:hypothetical protein
MTSNVKFMNFYPFEDIETISPRPLLFITGDNAHSREFSEDAYERAAEPKELFIVPGAGHVDLYDRVNLIPFDKLTTFFTTHLKPIREAAATKDDAMKIRLKLQGKNLTATLYDNPTASEFASLLPLTLTLQDYAKTEKISDLPRKLTTEGAPAGSDPAPGDIAYYAPWGNLAVFYKDFGYSSGLVILGRLDDGTEDLDMPGSISATIERANSHQD